MYLKKSKKAIHNTCVAGLALLLMSACGQSSEQQPSSTDTGLANDEFSVMTFNVGGYGFLDRNGDGQIKEFKPEEERQAVLRIIADARPDVLALQEMGGASTFSDFIDDLQAIGLHYPFHELLQRDQSEQNLAVLSRFPIIASQRYLDDVFSVGDAQVPVQRGFLEVDIAVNPTYQFRLMVAQLKSKEYHPLGHTEMRRSEARLMNNHIRRSLGREPRLNLLVLGDMNDHIRAAPLRALMGAQSEYLIDLKPVDPYGEIWTAFDADNESYLRYDYILVSPYMMPEHVAAKSHVVRHPHNKLASTRRPVLAVFRSRDIAPAAEPMLPSYYDDEEP